MKKLLILAMLFLVMGCAPVWAMSLSTETPITVGFKGVDAGTFVNLKDGDNDILLGMTMPLIGYKSVVALNLGLLSDLKSRPIGIASLDINLKTVMSWIGGDFWLGEPLKLGIWFGNNIETAEHGWKLGNAKAGLYGNITVPLPAFLQ